MAKHPVCFGVWHAYKHCVERVHSKFLAWWHCLERDELVFGNPDGVLVYAHTKFISLELTITAVRLIGPKHMGRIQRAAEAALGDPNDRVKKHRMMLLRMLKLLVVEYAPALFELGVDV